MSKITVKDVAAVLTRKQFQAWLEAKHPRSYIGVAGEGDACPLARYLKGTLGAKNIESLSVDNDTIDIDTPVESEEDYDDYDGYVHVNTPGWAANFIERVDSLGEYRITAQKALKVLKASRASGYVPMDPTY